MLYFKISLYMSSLRKIMFCRENATRKTSLYTSSIFNFFFFCSFPYCVTMHAKLLQLYPSLCDSMGCRLPDSPVYGTVQVRILSGLPFPPPGDLPDPGIEPRSLAFPALAGWFFTTGAIWKVLFSLLSSLNANLPLLSLMLPHF